MRRYLKNIFAFFGFVSLLFICMLAWPVKEPAMLQSVYEGAISINKENMPKATRFQARDGTHLAYRLYPSASNNQEQLAILVHGSSGSSLEMHMIAKALAANDITSVAMDVRGHGVSGSRGDIGYIGQLEDDLNDLVNELIKAYPTSKYTLIGHSSGGGFALRVADGPYSNMFHRFILLAPYLGPYAPTNRQSDDASKWVDVSIPRIVAINMLSQLGIDWPQSLPTIAFATAPNSKKFVTPSYTFRLMVDFGPPNDYKYALQNAHERIVVLAGTNDELMDSLQYKMILEPLGVKVILLDDVDHMGILYTPSSLEAITLHSVTVVSATKGLKDALIKRETPDN